MDNNQEEEVKRVGNAIKGVKFVFDDGNEISVDTKTKHLLGKKPPFVKVMKNDILHLFSLPDKTIRLFLILAASLDYGKTNVDATYSIFKDYFLGNKTTYYKHLSILINEGILTRQGRGRGTFYIMNERYAKFG